MIRQEEAKEGREDYISSAMVVQIETCISPVQLYALIKEDYLQKLSAVKCEKLIKPVG